MSTPETFKLRIVAQYTVALAEVHSNPYREPNLLTGSALSIVCALALAFDMTNQEVADLLLQVASDPGDDPFVAHFPPI